MKIKILMTFIFICNFLFSDANEDLFLGIEKRDVKKVELAIKNGANVNCKNKYGNSALIEASKNDLIEIMIVLIKNNANLNSKGEYEQTAFNEAVSSNSLNAIKLLIENGSKIDESDVINAHSKESLKIILNSKARINGLSKNDEEIITTIFNDDKNKFETILNSRNNIDFKDKNNKTSLMYASICSSFNIINLLIEKNVDINEKNNYGDTALIFAVQNNLLDVVNLLLKNGADVNTKENGNWTPLMYATSKEITESLIKNGAKLEYDNESALMIATIKNEKDVAKVLIENGANVNYKTKYGQTPLMYASSKNAKEILELLIKNGADINAINSLNRTALIEAVINNSKEAVEILIKNKSNLDYVPDGILWGSALTEASKINAKEIAQLLIDAGANIEIKDYFEMTPLMVAVKNNSQDVIKILLKNEANIYAKSFNKNVIEFSNEENKKEIEKLFTNKLIEGLNNNIKYANEAVTIWNTELKRRDGDYRKAIGLFIDYQNNTMKRIVGISLQVEVINPFGKIVFSDVFDEEILIEPREKIKNNNYWKFEDNEYISEEPYDLIWRIADNRTAKINVKILKVIFDDGIEMISELK